VQRVLNALVGTYVLSQIAGMKIVTVNEVSRNFRRLADFSLKGETVRVFHEGKPYVQIVPDAETPEPAVPHVDFAARAKKDFPKKSVRTNVVKQIIRNRR
jgi:hypothetical protein